MDGLTFKLHGNWYMNNIQHFFEKEYYLNNPINLPKGGCWNIIIDGSKFDYLTVLQLPQYLDCFSGLLSIEIINFHNVEIICGIPKAVEYLLINNCEKLCFFNCFSGIKTLDITGCVSIKSLDGDRMNNLYKLTINNTLLSSFNELFSFYNLKEFYANNAGLKKLPMLDNSVRIIEVMNNDIKQINDVPSSLISLKCDDTVVLNPYIKDTVRVINGVINININNFIKNDDCLEEFEANLSSFINNTDDENFF